MERFLHRGLVPTRTHQPNMLLCSPTGEGGGWELRLGLQRSDPRERTGVGCMKGASAPQLAVGASAPQLAGRESRKMSGTA